MSQFRNNQIFAFRRNKSLVVLFGVLNEKEAYRVARNLLKGLRARMYRGRSETPNLSPPIRGEAQAKVLREIRKQTKDFSSHWAEFTAAGLAKVKNLEAYVKRKLVAAGDFKDLRKKVASHSLLSTLPPPNSISGIHECG